MTARVRAYPLPNFHGKEGSQTVRRFQFSVLQPDNDLIPHTSQPAHFPALSPSPSPTAQVGCTEPTGRCMQPTPGPRAFRRASLLSISDTELTYEMTYRLVSAAGHL